MPQLDFLIILPQVFWLIMSFIFFYYFLTYYFLPIFLKTMTARKKFIKFNKSFEIQLTHEIFEKRQLMLKDLNLNLNKIRSVLFLNLISPQFSFQQKPFQIQHSNLNLKVLIAINKSIFYCNSNLINLLKFYPNILN